MWPLAVVMSKNNTMSLYKRLTHLCAVCLSKQNVMSMSKPLSQTVWQKYLLFQTQRRQSIYIACYCHVIFMLSYIIFKFTASSCAHFCNKVQCSHSFEQLLISLLVATFAAIFYLLCLFQICTYTLYDSVK